MAIITLLTDFGTADGFVGAMKGVVLSRAPDATVVDITHDIPAWQVREGALTLRRATREFPEGTIHVAVIDPGVGSTRRAILLHSRGHFFIGPDNGLLSLAVDDDDARCWELTNMDLHRTNVSHTFHGRDIFASVAGHLAAGTLPDDCGVPLNSWERLELPQATRQGSEVMGTVLHFDRFGNAITNIDEGILGPDLEATAFGPEDSGTWRARLGERSLGRLKRTFSDVKPGAWVAYIGSGGAVEIAIRNGSAESRGAAIDETVTLALA